MKITDVEDMLISIPLSRPAKMTVRTWNTRDYLVVRVHTDEGITGCGYTLAKSAVLGAVKDILSPLVVGGITEWMKVAALASAWGWSWTRRRCSASGWRKETTAHRRVGDRRDPGSVGEAPALPGSLLPNQCSHLRRS